MRLRTPSSPAPSRTTHHLASPLLGVAAGVALLGLLIGIPLTAQAATTPVAAPVETRAVDSDAVFFVGLARTTAAQAEGKVDTTDLKIEIAQLDGTTGMNEITVGALTGQLRATTAQVAEALHVYEQQQAAAAAAAAALAAANTPDGARATARELAADQYGWGDGQFSCLDSLWQKESSWNYQAENSSSGAYGIPQALPGSKMSSVADDWQTVAATQIAWGLRYIAGSYGTPCAAWAHSQATNWY
ncbi:phospholipase [Microbacterium sp. SORGH_AS_0888]|uniref:aggregation-promoting factor C-terminal-like domain-containing protein n=1 Tax=Microbacterium sp. SORGH_AS_0888 TaxID=3041791 RepID=UPI00277E33F6|nr:phospholipase [Microbacterium sp. SORGH_AS_0888]MDQ1129960.1 pyruvate/2-oxoglutarate dehydrogenase complex dihydrolipoamide acyltransferase (E2) component [Microbacterium sp. SORGH_AS_0888]